MIASFCHFNDEFEKYDLNFSIAKWKSVIWILIQEALKVRSRNM